MQKKINYFEIISFSTWVPRYLPIVWNNECAGQPIWLTEFTNCTIYFVQQFEKNIFWSQFFYLHAPLRIYTLIVPFISMENKLRQLLMFTRSWFLQFSWTISYHSLLETPLPLPTAKKQNYYFASKNANGVVSHILLYVFESALDLIV